MTASISMFVPTVVKQTRMSKHPKSRGGCARCKKHHLKCDEKRPSCGRCVRLHVKCPGYHQALKWSNKHEIRQSDLVPAICPDNLSNDSGNSFAGVQLDLASNEGPAATELFGHSMSNETPLIQEADIGAAIQRRAASTIFVPDLGCVYDTASQGPSFSAFGDDLFWLTSTPLASAFDEEDLILQGTANGSRPVLDGLSTSSVSSTCSIPPPMSDTGTFLVGYYFKEPARLYSCFDSDLNPFLTRVSSLWQESKVIYYSLQSMAAAHMASVYPEASSQGRDLQRQAIEALSEVPSSDECHLLALLMIGGTTSWHNPRDLGIPVFNMFHKFLDEAGRRPGGLPNSGFYYEALIFWELLLSFAVDDAHLRKSPDLKSPPSISGPTQLTPHPWTGFARDIQVICCQIGRLVRSQRRQAHRRFLGSRAMMRNMHEAVSHARELEKRLVESFIPSDADVIDPGDAETPAWHLITLAEVYRRTGLLQLYRVFPDLLEIRLIANSEDVPNVDVCKFPAFGIPSRLSVEAGDVSLGESIEYDWESKSRWLTRFALSTLDLLFKVPITSGTKDFQPFCLVACCSELRLPARPGWRFPVNSHCIASVESTIPDGCALDAISVKRTRALLMNRLESFKILLPPNPIQVGIDIVKTTWERLDNAQPGEDVYWMDVMTENGWDTCLA